jgi:hypothetical protein
VKTEMKFLAPQKSDILIWGLFVRLFVVPINGFAFLVLVLEDVFDLYRIYFITARMSVQ